MIKGFGFGKLLKQLFIISLISCFGLLVNYSEASCSVGYNDFEGNYVHCNSMAIDDFYNSNSYYIGGFYDYRFNFIDRVFHYDIPGIGNIINFWWEYDGSLSYSYKSTNGQTKVYGNIDGFFVSNMGVGGNDTTYYLKDAYGFTYIEGMQNIVNYIDDTFIYGNYFCGSNSLNCKICLANSSQWASTSTRAVCIDRSYTSGNGNGFKNTNEALRNASKNPYYDLGSSYGSGYIDLNNGVLNGDYNYTLCTYEELINYYNYNGYSEYYCYGGLDNFNLYNSETVYNPIPGTGKSLFDIVNYSNSWSSPGEWFNFWNGLYGNSNYNSMWESYPAVFHTRFDIYNMYHGYDFGFNQIYSYCKLLRSSKLDGYSNFYKGTELVQACRYIKQNPNYSSSGEVYLGVNWNGVGNLSGEIISNPVLAIQKFFDRLKSSINTDYGNSAGVLPLYIGLFLMLIILFRFIGH